MSSLVIIPYVIVLVLLVFATACLVYDRGAYKAQISDLTHKLSLSKSEIRALKGYIDNKEKVRKPYTLYTFDSEYDRIENVVSWERNFQHLRLNLSDGSVCVVDMPSRYKLTIQDQSEEEPSE